MSSDIKVLVVSNRNTRISKIHSVFESSVNPTFELINCSADQWEPLLRSECGAFCAALVDIDLVESVMNSPFFKSSIPIVVLGEDGQESQARELVAIQVQDYLLDSELGGKALIKAIRSSIQRYTLAKREAGKSQWWEHLAYVVSHDLQAPVRHISSYVQVLREELGDRPKGDVSLAMSYVEKGARRITSLIDDLAALAKIKKSERAWGSVNLTTALESAKKSVGLADCEGLVVEASGLGKVRGQESLVQDLFVHLLDNAIKFKSDERVVKIEVFQKEERGSVVVGVRDNGIGIKDGDLTSVFNIFHRLHVQGQFEGNGIGLSLCKRIVDLHQGEIWAEAVEGGGSTFYFQLPTDSRSGL